MNGVIYFMAIYGGAVPARTMEMFADNLLRGYCETNIGKIFE